MSSIESITAYLLDSAIDDAGDARRRDGSFAIFASSIDEEGKIETYRVPQAQSPTTTLRAELTAITTAVTIVTAAAADAIDVHIDYRNAEPVRIRARYRLKERFLRKPDLELTGEIETCAAERIVFGPGAADTISSRPIA